MKNQFVPTTTDWNSFLQYKFVPTPTDWNPLLQYKFVPTELPLERAIGSEHIAGMDFNPSKKEDDKKKKTVGSTNINNFNNEKI